MDFNQAEKTARGPAGDMMALWTNRAKSLYEAAESVIHLDGEFWEMGVYRGGSAKLISELIRSSDKPRIFRLFDTFQGFTGITDNDEGSGQEGEMKYWQTVDYAIQNLGEFLRADFVRIHPGAVPDSLSGLNNSKIAYAYLDMDLYYPTREAMKFILPRMVSGGIIVIDDCGDKVWPGVLKAVNETKGDLDLVNTPFQSPYDLDYCGWQGVIRIP
jgi:O-methyltransferase